MIKRNVKFAIAADGTVSPAVPQYGGVKGEHNATLLGVSLASGVYTAADTVRLSFTTGDGTVLSSDLIETVTVSEEVAYIEYEVPQILTVSAGQLCVRVVLSRMENSVEVQTFRSGEMVLYFDEASLENGTPFWTGVSQMLARTVTAKDTAVDSASKAVTARDVAYTHAKEAHDRAMQAAQFASEAKSAQDVCALKTQTSSEQAAKAEESAVEAGQFAEKAEQAATAAQEAVETPGRRGASAYEVALANGFEGSETAWLASLKGERGVQGAQGEPGQNGAAAGFGVVHAVVEVLDAAAAPTANVSTYGEDTAKSFLFRFGIPGASGGSDDTAIHYKGEVVSGTQLASVEKVIGDVYFITGESRFYMWTGTKWEPLAVGEKGDKGDPYTLTDADKASIVEGAGTQYLYGYTTVHDIGAEISTTAQLYALYDALVTAYPNYVTKNVLGQNSLGTDIVEYVFTSGNYNTVGNRNRDAEIQKPVVLIITGLHGDETASIISTYKFFKDLCDRSASLASLRENLAFKVVPVVCPYGFDNKTRLNENDVNLNRNFTTNWSYINDGYDNSGESAADQAETQIIEAWIEANSTAVLFLDFHNSGYGNEVGYLAVAENTAHSIKAKKSFLKAVSQMRAYWQKVHGFSDSLIYAYVGRGSDRAVSYKQAYAKGLLGVLIETSWTQNGTAQNGVVSNAVGAEVLGNTLIEIAKDLSFDTVMWEKEVNENEVEVLPAEYQKVAYIETDGNQYIDTGVLASDYADGIAYAFSGNMTAMNGTSMYLFGCLDGGVRSGNLCRNEGTASYIVYAGGTSDIIKAADSPGYGADFTATLLVSSAAPQNMVAKLNGKDFVAYEEGAAADMPTASVYLLWCRGVSADPKPFYGKLYSFTMTAADGTPIREFVPCYRKADGVIGLYDTVSGAFYENAGTGAFTKGADM